MGKRTQQNTERSGPPPKLVGIQVRPRDTYWAEMLASVESFRAAAEQGNFEPGNVDLPKPRSQPVYETSDGSRVLAGGTRGGFATTPCVVASDLEVLKTGGLGGGLLSIADNQLPLPLAGGARAEQWLHCHLNSVPPPADLAPLCADSSGGPGARPVGTGTPAFEAAALARRSVGRGDRGDTHDDGLPPAVSAAPRTSGDPRTASPAGVFQHTTTARTLALAAALQKSGPGFAQALFAVLAGSNSGAIADALQQDLAERAALPGGDDGRSGVFRRASKVIEALCDDEPGERLAALCERKDGSDESPMFSAAMDGLRQTLIAQIVAAGSEDESSPLAALKESSSGSGAAGSALGALAGFLGPAGDKDALDTMVVMDEAGAFGGGGKSDGPVAELLGNVPGAVVDHAFGELLGSVDDSSSMGKQLLAKYQSQIKSLLTKVISSGGLADLQKQVAAIVKGMPSSASVPLGRADPMGGGDLVLVNGLPATRIGDICKWPDVPDAGPFFQGNPTILINGMPPAGAIHAARGVKGTIGTPKLPSLNVLMGEATVSVKISVKTESPAEAGSAEASPSVGSGGGGGTAAPEGEGMQETLEEGAHGATEPGTSKAGADGPSKPGMTERDKREYQGLSDKLDALGDRQRELYDRLNSGEISEEEFAAENGRLGGETDALSDQMQAFQNRFDSSEFDSDGYLRDPIALAPTSPDANAIGNSQDDEVSPESKPAAEDAPTPAPTAPPGQDDAAQRAARLRAKAKKLAAQADVLDFIGADQQSAQLSAAADVARIEAARLEGGAEAAARETEVITVRRAVQEAIDKGLDRLPPGPARKVAKWVKTPISSGLGQLTEETVRWLQEHGYVE